MAEYLQLLAGELVDMWHKIRPPVSLDSSFPGVSTLSHVTMCPGSGLFPIERGRQNYGYWLSLRLMLNATEDEERSALLFRRRGCSKYQIALDVLNVAGEMQPPTQIPPKSEADWGVVAKGLGRMCYSRNDSRNIGVADQLCTNDLENCIPHLSHHRIISIVAIAKKDPKDMEHLLCKDPMLLLEWAKPTSTLESLVMLVFD